MKAHKILDIREDSFEYKYDGDCFEINYDDATGLFLRAKKGILTVVAISDEYLERR